MLIFGHRGASCCAPENTMSAILEGLRQGADGIEIDVRLTKDRTFIVMHDANFLRTTGVDTCVSRARHKLIHSLDCGAFKGEKFKGERVPYLKNVLDAIPEGKLLQIELKSRIKSVPHLVKELGGSRKKLDEIIVIGFDYFSMKLVKELLPAVRVAWINGKKKQLVRKNMHKAEILIKKLKDARLDAVDFDSRFDIDAQYVSKIHAAGFKVYSWTVDDPARAVYFRDIGIDGIATNAPDMIRSAINFDERGVTESR